MLTLKLLNCASFKIECSDDRLLTSDIKGLSGQMKRSDRIFRAAKALVNNPVFKVDRSDLSVPATGEEHLSRLVVERAVDWVFELIDEVTDTLGGVPLPNCAIIRARKQPIRTHNRLQSIDSVSVPNQWPPKPGIERFLFRVPLPRLDTEVTLPSADQPVSVGCEKIVIRETDTDQYIALGPLDLLDIFLLR